MSKRKAVVIDEEPSEEEWSDEENDEWCREVSLSPSDATEYWEEAWLTDGEDEWCAAMDLPAGKRRRLDVDENTDSVDMQEGGALFEFSLSEGSMPRRWKNVVNKTRFTSRLVQRRDATPSDHLGQELTNALQKVLRTVVSTEKGLHARDKAHFTMQSSAFSTKSNHCFQSTQFEVGELRESSVRFTDYLAQLARQLNSSQSFSSGDEFELGVATIQMPREGGTRKKYDVVKAVVRHIHKRCVVKINNQDDSCCARALVTMRAYVDEKSGDFPQTSYDNLPRVKPAQTRQVRELMTLAGVGEGPCGLAELQKFQDVLPDYQIKVVHFGRPHMIIFSGPIKPRKLLLVLDRDHYDGCTSFAAFFNRQQYCYLCDSGFNEDDFSHHPCEGRRCPSCHDKECADYTRQRENHRRVHEQVPPPTRQCVECWRSFYGEECFQRHGVISNKVSNCKKFKKCQTCSKSYELELDKNGRRKGRLHRCGYGECTICDKWCLLAEHRCFIQRLDDNVDKEKTKKVSRDEVGARTVVTVEGEEDEVDGKVTVAKEPPLLVFADFEAVTDDDGV